MVWDHANDAEPYGVRTGDALFIGDVGRPELLASFGFTRDELAEQLYDSVHDKLLTLPDATRVYPAHGAGSACGKNLSTDTWSTIGDQRTSNYALAAPDKAAFVDLVTEGQPPAPSYFVYDAERNRQDRALHDEAVAPDALALTDVDAWVAAGAVLLDGRDPVEFARGHISGSINVGLEGRYAEFAGSVIEPDVDIVLSVEPGREREARTRLARIGFDRVVGALSDPLAAMAAHPERIARASRLTALELAERRRSVDDLQLVDVRNPGEVALGSIEGALPIPVGQLPGRLDELDSARPTVVFCAGGYRSSVAASVLRRFGFHDVSDVLRGFGAWRNLADASVH